MTDWITTKITPDDENREKIFIESTGTTGYAIRSDFNGCLNKRGVFEYEPLPSSRSAAFLKRCRFPDAETAKQAYEKYKQGVVICE
jgi:hypothetical protein